MKTLMQPDPRDYEIRILWRARAPRVLATPKAFASRELLNLRCNDSIRPPYGGTSPPWRTLQRITRRRAMARDHGVRRNARGSCAPNPARTPRRVGSCSRTRHQTAGAGLPRRRLAVGGHSHTPHNQLRSTSTTRPVYPPGRANTFGIQFAAGRMEPKGCQRHRWVKPRGRNGAGANKSIRRGARTTWR